MDGIAGTFGMVRQLTDLLAELDREDYTQGLPLLSGATLGQHFRHIIDFYLSLLRDIPSGTVDYGRRERDLRLETDPAFAKNTLQALQERVESLNEENLLRVRTEFSDQPGAERPEVSSSVGRELMYAYDHALHHLAIIRIGLESLRPDLTLAEELGVAPSTLKHQRSKQEK